VIWLIWIQIVEQFHPVLYIPLLFSGLWSFYVASRSEQTSVTIWFGKREDFMFRLKNTANTFNLTPFYRSEQRLIYCPENWWKRFFAGRIWLDFYGENQVRITGANNWVNAIARRVG
jgi:hypothetical protein